jgi:hypothetical protein
MGLTDADAKYAPYCGETLRTHLFFIPKIRLRENHEALVDGILQAPIICVPTIERGPGPNESLDKV